MILDSMDKTERFVRLSGVARKVELIENKQSDDGSHKRPNVLLP